MRVVFVGATSFGMRCLNEIRQMSCCNLVGVVTSPKLFPISYNPEGVTNVLHADIEGYCRQMEIPSVSVNRGMNDQALLDQVRSWNPDIFIVVGWYHMIPKFWRQTASAYGLHASLLPKYSGGAPLVWSIIRGEREAGITLFQFNDGVDAGPIVGQRSTEITKLDTIATVYSRIEQLGVELIREYLPHIARGDVMLIEQDESKREYVPQRSPRDGLIDWSNTADRVYDFVRAQTKPYPGAYFFDGKDQITVWSAQEVNAPNFMPPNQGEIRCSSDGIMVGCGKNTAIILLDIAVNGEDMSAIQRFGTFVK